MDTDTAEAGGRSNGDTEENKKTFQEEGRTPEDLQDMNRATERRKDILTEHQQDRKKNYAVYF